MVISVERTVTAVSTPVWMRSPVHRIPRIPGGGEPPGGRGKTQRLWGNQGPQHTIGRTRFPPHRRTIIGSIRVTIVRVMCSSQRLSRMHKQQ